MKLNYTSLQHTVDAGRGALLGSCNSPSSGRWRCSPCTASWPQRRLGLRAGRARGQAGLRADRGRSAARWALAHGRALRERGLLAGHLTAGAAFGGEGEAITTAGALHHGCVTLGWDAAVCGPGPGHRRLELAARARGHVGARLRPCRPGARLPTLLVARMSLGDPRARHRGISHHTLTVLDLLLEPVTVALPAGMRSPVGADLRAGLGAVFDAERCPAVRRCELEVERPARITRHDWRRALVDLPGLRRRRPAGRDDGPGADRGPAVLRGGPRRHGWRRSPSWPASA
jgi:hypothetical protein